MTQEEKARAYDKAIEKIKYVMEHGVSPTFNKEDLQDLFPELKESEDERIRKSIIHLVNISHEQGGYALSKDEAEEMLAWIEKQGEPFNDNIITRDDEILQAISIGLTDVVEDAGWSDFGGIPIEEIQSWLEKQIEKKEINPTLQEKSRMDDAFTKMMLKPQVDGFDAKLAESENEKIRKALVCGMNALKAQRKETFAGIPINDCIVWLEKQTSKPKWTEEDDYNVQCCIAKAESDIADGNLGRNKELIDWLKSIKERMEEQQ